MAPDTPYMSETVDISTTDYTFTADIDGIYCGGGGTLTAQLSGDSAARDWSVPARSSAAISPKWSSPPPRQPTCLASNSGARSTFSVSARNPGREMGSLTYDRDRSGYGDELSRRMGLAPRGRDADTRRGIYADFADSAPVGRGATMQGTQLVLGGKRSVQTDARGLPSGSQYAQPTHKSDQAGRLDRGFSRAGYDVEVPQFHTVQLDALVGSQEPAPEPKRADGDLTELERRSRETKEMLAEAKRLKKEIQHLDSKSRKPARTSHRDAQPRRVVTHFDGMGTRPVEHDGTMPLAEIARRAGL